MGAAFRILVVSRDAGPLAEAMTDDLAGMGLEGVLVTPVAPCELAPELLEAQELVLCSAPDELEQVFALTSVRAYTINEYLGRSEDAMLEPSDAARQLTQQIGRELESDPARPGAAARD